MNLLISVVLTMGLHRPVLIFGCCPVLNVFVASAIPVLVIGRPVPVEPGFIAAKPHEAKI